MPFLLCPFNRYNLEKHLFRSPWSSQYFLEKNKGEDFKELFGEAHQELSGLEKRANELFNFYAELYHGGQESLATSFYIIDFERDEYIEGIFLLKKTTEESVWSTSHYFKITLKKDRTTFTCYSGVYTTMRVNGIEISYKNDAKEEVVIKDTNKDNKFYVAKMGEILEENERRFFNDFKDLWVPKSFEAVKSLRVERLGGRFAGRTPAEQIRSQRQCNLVNELISLQKDNTQPDEKEELRKKFEGEAQD